MKMVSAAKLRKAQDAILQMRPYAEKLHDIMQNVVGNLHENIQTDYGKVRTVKKVLLVVLASNRGLCGAFNSAVVKKVSHLIKEDYNTLYSEDNTDIIVIGKKAEDILNSRKIKIKSSFNELYDDLSFQNVLTLVEQIMKDFTDKKYDEVKILYNRFKNAAIQELVEEKFLPLTVEKPEEDKYETPSDFIIEPSTEYIVKDLIPKTLKIQFFKALLDSVASEHGARMTAMHKATDNATELIKDLQLEYNKARQAAITKEILEIVSGAEALKG
jgi:F-type H+-transporting ATPase subunit gamma